MKIQPIFFFFGPAFDVLLLDQLTKWLVLKYLEKPILLIPNFLSFELHTNTGIAFSIAVPQKLVIYLTYILLFLGIYIAHRELDTTKKTTNIFLGLALGGALGNLIDRIFRGYVVDFISLWIVPVFNIADMALMIGILGIIVFYGKIKKSSNANSP